MDGAGSQHLLSSKFHVLPGEFVALDREWDGVVGCCGCLGACDYAGSDGRAIDECTMGDPDHRDRVLYFRLYHRFYCGDVGGGYGGGSNSDVPGHPCHRAGHHERGGRRIPVAVHVLHDPPGGHIRRRAGDAGIVGDITKMVAHYRVRLPALLGASELHSPRGEGDGLHHKSFRQAGVPRRGRPAAGCRSPSL